MRARSFFPRDGCARAFRSDCAARAPALEGWRHARSAHDTENWFDARRSASRDDTTSRNIASTFAFAGA